MTQETNEYARRANELLSGHKGHRFTIGLLLIGIAVGQTGDRERITDHLANVIEDDPVLGRLVRAIRESDREQMAFGLAAFGVQMLPGERAVDAMLRTYIGLAKERLTNQLKALEQAEKHEIDLLAKRRVKQLEKTA